MVADLRGPPGSRVACPEKWLDSAYAPLVCFLATVVKTISRCSAVSGCLTRLALALLLCCASILVPRAWAAEAGARMHKLRVNDAMTAAALLAQGARLVADYGSFQVLETDAATVQTLAVRPAAAEAVDEWNTIHLNARPLDTTTTEVKALRQTTAAFAGKRLHLVHFVGPVKPEWRDALEKDGVQIVSYLPDNAYLVYGALGAIQQMQARAATADHVQWEGSYLDDYKIHPRARTVDALGQPQKPVSDTFAVQLVEDADANPATLQLIDTLKLGPVQKEFRLLGYVNVIVPLAPEQLAQIAARPEVVSIQPYTPRRKFCERQDQIIAGNLSGNGPSGPGYLAWLAAKGFTQAQFDASGFLVDVSDSGIDSGTTTPGHFGLYTAGNKASGSRVAYNRLEGTANSGSTLQGCDGHGNLNAHIIGGYDDLSGTPFADSSGYHYGLGVCPFVRVGSSVIFDPSNFTSPSYPNLASRAYRDGARISNNSWGGTGDGTYDVDCQSYDALVRDAQPTGSAVPVAGNQEMTFVFAAGNDGPSASTVGSPGTAKNIISVGAGENVQPIGGSDSSAVSDSGADSANDIIDFSSRGPCTDGRIKPDLCAPGTHVSGGVAQVASPAATGTAIACYTGEGVSGGVSSIYFPSAGQQFYTASSGTSHSTPGLAGSCALLRQYFINHSLTPPSPAMTKAYLMNSARYMTGAYANDTLPSNNQGMGEVNLGTAFDGAGRVLRDQLAADKFTAAGQTRTFTGVISESSKPFRVTLAWTDAPGSTTGNAYNNNLDLTVTVGANTYKGNVFSGAYSTTGGSSDAKNNAESVFLPAGVSGPFTVTVTAVNIPSDGVPNEAPATDQDFALVMYNASATAVPMISPDSASITAESCQPANGVLDPGETATVRFALRNVGNTNTTSLVATLLATGGVTAPSGPQIYGVLAAGGGAVTQAFSFTASGICGSTITATLQLQDGATNLGTATFSFPMGQLATLFTESFDGVTAPALPAGWTTSTTGGQAAWNTSATTPDTSPNAAYSAEASSAGVNELVSPVMTLPGGSAQLSFRHSYNLEYSGTTAYDGGVLEIKIGAGAFTDILAAGGSFVSGGYTNTVSASYSNPLTNRACWSGNSGGYVTSVVNLPASAAGQAIQLRWRCGTDSSSTVSGWRVDGVAVSARICCGDVQAPLIITPPQSQTVLAGSNATFTVSATGAVPLTYQWRKNSALISGATSTTYTLSNVQTNDAGGYDVVVSNSVNSVTSAVATLAVTIPLPPSTNAAVIAQWNFNSLTPDSSSTTGTLVPSVGTGTASIVGSLSTSFASGSSADPATTDNTAWTTASYPAQTGANKSAGVQFNVNTVGQRNLVVWWSQRASSTASKYVRLQYSTNGSIFTDFALPATVGAGSTYESKTNTLAGLPGVDNNPNFAFRIVTEWQSTAIGSGTAGFVAANSSSSYGTSGTLRFDMVTISGQPFGIAPSILASPTNQAVVVGGVAAFAVSASGTAPLNYQWRKTGAILPGQTGLTLSLSNITLADAAGYDAVVNNAYGWATSAVATLTVFLPPTLHIQLQGTNVLLAWPAAGGTYQVLSGSALSAAWQPANSPVLTSGATAIVTLPTTSTQQFYRLQRIGP